MKEEPLIKYEKPRLIELGTEKGQGQPDCSPGSSATDNCTDGGNATVSCSVGGYHAIT